MGAGRGGIDYYRLLYRQKVHELVLQVDKECEKHNDIYTPVYDSETIKTIIMIIL